MALALGPKCTTRRRMGARRAKGLVVGGGAAAMKLAFGGEPSTARLASKSTPAVARRALEDRARGCMRTWISDDEPECFARAANESACTREKSGGVQKRGAKIRSVGQLVCGGMTCSEDESNRCRHSVACGARRANACKA
eukprot:5989245-Pleurochrysis_carterae.AAC.2